MDAARKAANEARRKNRKSRGRGLRKRTGCLTCRRRHLKCDETTPECGQCGKSHQVCTWPAPSTESTRSPAPAETDESVRRSETPELSQIDKVTINHQDLPTQRAASPCAPTAEAWRITFPDQDEQAANGLLHLNSASSFSSYPAGDTAFAPTSISYSESYAGDQLHPPFHAAATPPDVAFHRWLGLLANDAAQEDAWRPLMVTPGSTGQLLPMASPAQSNASTALTSALPRASIQDGPLLPAVEGPQGQPRKSVAWRGSEPAKLSPQEHILFENFVDNISSWIDLHDSLRCFSIFVPHLALHDAGLMYAILALSSRHLSISQHALVEQRDRSVAVQYYFETLHYLQKAMHYEAYTVSLELLATALIVSTYEMLDDYGNGWERHLEGVFWIQRSQVIHGESGGLKQAVWWAWLRQDIWAAFRERRKTLSFWKPQRTVHDMNPYELSRRSIWHFAKAVDYCSEEEICGGETKIQARVDRAEALFAMLDDWWGCLTVEFSPMPKLQEKTYDGFEPVWIHPPAFAVSVQLYHAARLLILLHKPSFGGVRGNMRQQKLLLEAAKTICGISLTLKDAASSIVSSQCLYIAGLCLQEQQHRESVINLIDTCHQRTGWPTQSFSDDLRDEWQKLDNE